MTPAEALRDAVDPALALLPLAPYTSSVEARVMLLAIGLQESRLVHRRQMGGGPARGLWQFEQGTRASRGGVWGVYLHSSTHEALRELCRACDVSFDPVPIYQRLEHNDVFAAGVARLLLWSDPIALPALHDAAGGWALYMRTWRPGKPHRETWDGFHAAAVEAVVPPTASPDA